jgi:type IX secretion system PorP/SprF family membrane protein
MKNWIKSTLCIIGLLTAAKSTMAQQEVIYSQHMFNTLALNPAYAGSRDVLSLTAVGRYQWLNQFPEGAPQTHSFSLDMPFRNEKMGLGIIAYNDAIGVTDNTGLNLAYSYRLRLGQKTTMALGLQPTVSNLSLKLSKVNNLVDLSDPIFNGQDQNKFFFNAGLGVYFSNDKSYLGFSVPQIIEHKILPGDSSIGRTKRHYFLNGGFVLGKGSYKLKPSFVVRGVPGSPIAFDLNMNFWIKDKIAFGVSGRKSQAIFIGRERIDAIVGMLELQLTPQLRLGYAYDYNNLRSNEGSETFGKLTNTPTHEWLLRYEFGYGKSKILTPRYF